VALACNELIYFLADLRCFDQGCSLGRDDSVSRRSRDVVSKRLGLVSVSWKRGKVSDSLWSRTENIGLVPWSRLQLQANMHSFIAKCHVHRIECKASILFTDSQV